MIFPHHFKNCYCDIPFDMSTFEPDNLKRYRVVSKLSFVWFLLYKSCFVQELICTKVVLYKSCFVQEFLYTRVVLCKSYFVQELFNARVDLYKSCFMQELFCTRVVLQKSCFVQELFYERDVLYKSCVVQELSYKRVLSSQFTSPLNDHNLSCDFHSTYHVCHSNETALWTGCSWPDLWSVWMMERFHFFIRFDLSATLDTTFSTISSMFLISIVLLFFGSNKYLSDKTTNCFSKC